MPMTLLEMFESLPPLELIDRAIEEHKPSALFALFSGGHDSLVNTHITAQHPAFTAVVHLNTGIGIDETREFVRETCRTHGWPLIEKTPPRVTYEDICLASGMPGGPQGHAITYHRLKSESLDELIREHKTHRRDRILLSSGVRKAESVRRMGFHKEAINRDGVRVWVNPILEWDGHDINNYITDHELKRNEVVDKLHRSGECLCGALARPEELNEISFWYPEVGMRIKALEQECFARGLPWNWGSKQTPVPHKDQGSFLEMCSSCETRWEAEQ